MKTLSRLHFTSLAPRQRKYKSRRHQKQKKRHVRKHQKKNWKAPSKLTRQCIFCLNLYKQEKRLQKNAIGDTLNYTITKCPRTVIDFQYWICALTPNLKPITAESPGPHRITRINVCQWPIKRHCYIWSTTNIYTLELYAV